MVAEYLFKRTSSKVVGLKLKVVRYAARNGRPQILVPRRKTQKKTIKNDNIYQKQVAL